MFTALVFDLRHGVAQVCGQPVGVHVSNGVDVEQASEAASLPDAPETPSEGEEASISKLLGALRCHTDKHAAVQAAFRAVMQTPQLQVRPSCSWAWCLPCLLDSRLLVWGSVHVDHRHCLNGGLSDLSCLLWDC